MNKKFKDITPTVIDGLHQTLLSDVFQPQYEIASDDKHAIIIIKSDHNTTFDKRNIKNENITVNKQELIFGLVGLGLTLITGTWILSSQINSSVNEARKEIMAFSQSEKVEIGNRISKVEDHIIRVEDKITKVDEKVSNEFNEVNKSINEIRMLLINKEQIKNK